MSVNGRGLYIDLDHDALTIARVDVRNGVPRVEASASARRPESANLDDASSVGAWIARVLDDSNLGRGRAVFAVARSEVVLKLLHLPGGEGLEENELAGVVRLQMTRQAAVAIEDAVIDYVPLAGVDGQTERLVLVGAIPGERVEWRRKIADACGLKLGGVRLRAAGVAELIAATGGGGGGAPTLGVSLGPSSVELVLCEDGDLVFARTVELGEAVGSPDRTASRVAVEAKRTAMSFRVAQRTPDVSGVVVLGRDDLARHVALACAEELEVPAEAVWPNVEGLDSEKAERQRALLPLAGLARRERAGRGLMDFAEPRRVPDQSARRRQVALGLAFVGIAVIGTAWLLSQRHLAALNERRDQVRGQLKDKVTAYVNALAADARASNVERWRSEDVDWLAHIDRVAQTLPGPDEALLDSLSGADESAVRFTAGERGGYPGRWSVDRRVSLEIAGRAAAPGVGVDLRAKLLDMGDYHVETKGPDVENSFTFELSTARTAPAQKPSGEAAP
ncbi:MAG: pilus assembly protein PilM [Phycisphaerales bacterium]